MPEGTIDGKPYPISVNEKGEVLWQTVGFAEEKDEVWDDWSLGMGEDYLFSKGFDGSIRNVLHLSPFYQADNNPTDLTTAYGYFMEDLGPSQSATLDSGNVSSDNVNDATLTWAHTVASGENRILVVDMGFNYGAADKIGSCSVTYGGVSLTLLGHGRITTGGAGNNGFTVSKWYLMNPPVGTVNVVVTIDATRPLAAGAYVYTGVNVADPWRDLVFATGTSTAPSVTIASATNDVVLDNVSTGVAGSAGALTATDDEAQEIWNDALIVSGNAYSRGAGSYEAGAASVTASWTLSASNGWVTMAASLKPLANERLRYVADGTKITEYKYDPDEGLTDKSTQTIASGVAGQPAFAFGKWYVPFGSGANVYRLDSPGTGTRWVDSGFTANHLATFQQGVTPLLLRANSGTANLLESVAAAPTADGDFATFGVAGDTGTSITHMVEVGGHFYVAKEDNLYEFGLEGESRPLIRFLNQGSTDPDNGKGMDAFGDIVTYPCNQGLWRYRIGSGVLPVGLESLRDFRRVPGITAPKARRPAYMVSAGEWWYVLQNSDTGSLLLQMRQRREGDPSGHEMIIHGALEIPLSKGLGVDSENFLWIKGASVSEGDRDIRVIKLDAHGGLDVENRRGQPSADHDICFKERNPGRPQDKVQLRHFTVDLGGDWDATTSLQPKVWLDNGTEAVNFGSAIISAGVTINNPTTFGTNDECYRLRPQLTLTTNASYTPKAVDPQIYKVIVGVRFPEVIRIVVAADDALLQGMTAIDAEQNLRRLQNQGVVAFLQPGELTTFNAEVTQVKDVMYQNTQGTYCHGLELAVTRWITN